MTRPWTSDTFRRILDPLMESSAQGMEILRLSLPQSHAAQEPLRFKSLSRRRASSSQLAAVSSNGLLSRPTAAVRDSVIVMVTLGQAHLRRSRKKASIERMKNVPVMVQSSVHGKPLTKGS